MAVMVQERLLFTKISIFGDLAIFFVVFELANVSLQNYFDLHMFFLYLIVDYLIVVAKNFCPRYLARVPIYWRVLPICKMTQHLVDLICNLISIGDG